MSRSLLEILRKQVDAMKRTPDIFKGQALEKFLETQLSLSTGMVQELEFLKRKVAEKS